MTRTILRKVGNSLGITIPKELLEKLNLKEGDERCLIKIKKGFELRPEAPDFAANMETYRHTARKHRTALRKLA